MTHMQDLKNLILTIVVCTIILTLWQYFYQVPRQAELKDWQEQQQQATEQALRLERQLNAPLDLSREEALTDQTTQRLPIVTPAITGSISLLGARFDDLTLKRYRSTFNPSSDPVVLLSPSNSLDVYFSEFGWLSGSLDVPVPNRKTVWRTESTSLTPDNPATLYWDNQQGQRFILELSIDENYLFTVHQRVENTADHAVTLFPYGRIQRGKAPDEGRANLILHQGLLGTMDGTLTEVGYSDIRSDEQIDYPDSHGWFGITDKYWLTAIIPDQTRSTDVSFKHYMLRGYERYQANYRGEALVIPAGGTNSQTQYFYAGAKKVALLDQYQEQLGVTLFDRAIDFGWLYFLTKPIFYALKFFHTLLGNFGLAILALTVCIKLLLFPLAHKQYVSLGKMRKLSPKIQELRERYKDDKMRMNQETMALYRKENVNPMSGCLPILIQLPIFFSLYKVLFITIEMRHAPFYGWIKDLSAPDPTSIFNLFGLLDWQPYGFLLIGIWPILMAVTMFIQFKLNPAPTDPIQAKVMKYMPWFFMVIVAQFPAGLVIYWAWSNFLSILQQWYIMRTVIEEKS